MKSTYTTFRWLTIITLTVLLATTEVFGQNNQVRFGQNRVQYKDFSWRYYQTEHFDVYFYGSGRSLSQFTALTAERELEKIGDRIDYRLPSITKIIVYNDISDLNQTNIGVQREGYDLSGTVKLFDNSLYVYYNGDHQHLQEQLRKGITRLMVERMLAGVSFQESLQNVLLLNLPDWFTEGLIRYLGEGWNVTHDAKLREAMLRGTMRDLNKLPDEDMVFVAHSLWHYVADKYGDGALANLLYLTRVNRSMDSGFNYVLGQNVAETLEAWYYYYLNRYKEERDASNIERPGRLSDVSFKRDKEIYGAVLSPQGDKIAYIDNEIGRYRVWVYNLADKKGRKVYRGGFKTLTQATDYKKPQLAWSPDNRTLAVLDVKRDKILLTQINTQEKDKEVKEIAKFDQVLHISYKDKRTLIISAVRNGQTDLFEYFIPSARPTQLTDDYHDDLYPKYAKINGREGVFFASNRLNDTLREESLDSILPTTAFDLFFLDQTATPNNLVRITNTPGLNEYHIAGLTDSSFLFLGKESGIANIYLGSIQNKLFGYRTEYVYQTENYIDSIIVAQGKAIQEAIPADSFTLVRQRQVPVYKDVGVNRQHTAYLESTDDFSTSEKGKVLLTRYRQRDTRFYLINPLQEKAEQYVTPNMQNRIQSLRSSTPVGSKAAKKPLDTTAKANPIVDTLIFQNKFTGLDTTDPYYSERLYPPAELDNEPESGYDYTRTRTYFLKFRIEDLGYNLDNNLLVTPYQPFNAADPVFNQPNLNQMIRFGITDIFENHKIHGGFRVPFNFRTFEFYVTYNNFKKRLDKSFTFYRRANNEDASLTFQGLPSPIDGRIAQHTHLLQNRLSYPIDVLNSIRLTSAYRHDRLVVKSTEFATLNTPNQNQNWLSTRLEYVHDNTVERAINIRNGFRANIFIEGWKEIPAKNDTVLGNVAIQVPQWNNAYIVSFGADVRHYQKLFKTMIWANRLAFASSVGTQKIAYYLGGQSSPWFPSFNRNTPVNTENGYVFQALATPLRGFQQNIRNGNSYAVFNSELRIPILQILSSNTVRNKFLRDFQIVTFFDAGTAWEGANPFRSNDEFDRTVPNASQQPTAIARLNLFKRPIVMGYGVGVRASLLGYFIRADLGWGNDTGERSGPRFQLGVGYDF